MTDDSSKAHASEADLAEPDLPAPDDRAAQEPSAKVSRLRLLCVALFFAAIMVVLNWPYQYRSVLGAAGNVDAPLDFNRAASDMPIMAGWPFRYSIEYSDRSDGPVGRFSMLALSYNIGLAALMIACALLYVYLRERKGRARAKSVSISDLLVLTLMLAGSFAYWKHLQASATKERELWSAVSAEGGAYTTSAWLPEIYASRIPNAAATLARRIHEVRVEHPSEELVAKLVKQPELRVVRFGGGDFDLRLLDRLASNSHLVDLRIAGRKLDARTMQVVGACKRLRRLNLMRTNVSIESLALLNDLANLESLHLVHSDVVLSELDDAEWTKSIRHLRLPHPQPGDAASVRIVGWPKLEDLLIFEFESQMNSTEMSVHLEDLPALTELGLDIFQKFGLKLRNLPALEKIYQSENHWQARIPRGGVAPGQIWCGAIDIDGVPELEELSFFAPGLKHFQIRNAPKFRLAGIGAFFRTLNRSSVYAPSLKAEVAAALIEGLGRSDGPTEVDLDAVPLKNADLSPISENKKIETLKLSYSGTNLAQWKGLEPMKSLKRLDLHGCEIDDEGIRWALDSFPELEHLSIFPKSQIGAYQSEMFFFPQADTLEIVDRPNLKTLDLGDYGANSFSNIRIVNSPNLAIPLQLNYVRNLELVNAKSVNAVMVSGPLHADAKFSGLDGVQFFAVGGPGVTDNVITALANCSQLTKLTLAYPSVTAEGLKQLPINSNFAALYLPGTPLNDEIIETWPDLIYLDAVDVSDTEVTAKGLQKLIGGRPVTHVAIDHTKMSSEELGFLADIEGLRHLSLAGIGISTETLDAILDNRSLVELTLSGTDLTKESLDLLANKGSSLRYLGLQGCTIDERSFRRLAVSQAGIRYDLLGTEVSTKLMTELLSGKRIFDAEEHEAQIAMQAMMATAQTGVRGILNPAHPEMINVRLFKELRDGMEGAETSSAIGTPSSPLGVQLGRWFGQAVFSQNATQDEESEVESSEDSETPGAADQPEEAVENAESSEASNSDPVTAEDEP